MVITCTSPIQPLGLTGSRISSTTIHSRRFNFPGIRCTLDSEIGTLVTVTIRLTVDTGSTSFTLVVPQVNLDQSNHAHITTFGVTALHRFSVVPAFNEGQTELYTVTELSGTAALVAF